MAERLLGRTFNRVAAAQQAAVAAPPPRTSTAAEPRPARAEGPGEPSTSGRDEPTAAAASASQDPIQRIMAAWKSRDYFRLMQLPPPGIDELGRPHWPTTPAEVSRAYRKLSVQVHPDKVPGPEARAAFDALSAAHKALTDPAQLEEVLKASLGDARARRDAADAAATLGERVVLQKERLERARELAKEESASFQGEIMRQMQRRQHRASWKKAAKSRYRQESDEEQLSGEEGSDGGKGKPGGGSGDEDSDSGVVRRAPKQRKKPRVIF